jgi:hypothetical protein
LKPSFFAFLGLVCSAAVGLALLAGEPSGTASLEVSLADLPYVGPSSYKVDSYIWAASVFQHLGKDRACKMLLTLAEAVDADAEGTTFNDRYKVFVLCRMLFTKRSGSRFRPAFFGGPFFLGATDHADWPLEPIELVDGVPFLITDFYLMGGEPERVTKYVRYCIENCDWNKEPFQLKTGAEKRAALRKLLASKKWRKPLTDRERRFLAEQTDNP